MVVVVVGDVICFAVQVEIKIRNSKRLSKRRLNLRLDDLLRLVVHDWDVASSSGRSVVVVIDALSIDPDFLLVESAGVDMVHDDIVVVRAIHAASIDKDSSAMVHNDVLVMVLGCCCCVGALTSTSSGMGNRVVISKRGPVGALHAIVVASGGRIGSKNLIAVSRHSAVRSVDGVSVPRDDAIGTVYNVAVAANVEVGLVEGLVVGEDHHRALLS